MIDGNNKALKKTITEFYGSMHSNTAILMISWSHAQYVLTHMALDLQGKLPVIAGRNEWGDRMRDGFNELLCLWGISIQLKYTGLDML